MRIFNRDREDTCYWDKVARQVDAWLCANCETRFEIQSIWCPDVMKVVVFWDDNFGFFALDVKELRDPRWPSVAELLDERYRALIASRKVEKSSPDLTAGESGVSDDVAAQ